MVSKDNYSVIKVIEQHARCIRYCYNDCEVSKADSQLLAFAFTSQYCISIDLRLDSKIVARSYIPFLQRNGRLDIILFGTFLKVVDGVIKNYTENFQEDTIWTYKRFKHACSCVNTYWDFIAPIKGIVEQFLTQPDPYSFRIINQWLNFMQRCNVRSLDLTTSLCEKYISFEKEMLTWEYDPGLIEELASVISEWCKPFSLTDDFIPKHGPGSIAGRKGRPSVGTKYEVMCTDHRLNFLSKYVGSIASYSPLPMGALNRCSDLVFVPKSLITQRTISKEPSSLQYFQQAVSRSLLRCIASTDAANHIDLQHQEYSRTLARKGSISGFYATIDLSDASDSVSVELVKRVFRRADVRNALLCCRSDRTRLDFGGQELVLSKFAPMGASTCFPVETIVFAACCELVRRRFKGRNLYYRVYGDDIIIDYRLVSDLLSVLEGLHFKVNSSKSFWKRSMHNFREACGGEYFDNVDVSPLRIPRKLRYYNHVMTSASNVIDSYVSLANEAFDFGYTTYRWYILERIRSMNEYIYRHLPYSTDGRIGITTWNGCCTNFRLLSRFSHTLQRKEFRCLTNDSSDDKKKCKDQTPHAFDESVRLFEWYRLSSYRSKDYKPSPESTIIVDIRPKTTVLRLKWRTLENG